MKKNVYTILGKLLTLVAVMTFGLSAMATEYELHRVTPETTQAELDAAVTMPAKDAAALLRNAGKEGWSYVLYSVKESGLYDFIDYDGENFNDDMTYYYVNFFSGNGSIFYYLTEVTESTEYEWHKITSAITQAELDGAATMSSADAVALLASAGKEENALVLYEINVGDTPGVYNFVNKDGEVSNSLTVATLQMMINFMGNANFYYLTETETKDYTLIGGAADLVEGGTYLIGYGESETCEYHFFYGISDNIGQHTESQVTDYEITEEAVTSCEAMPLTLVKNGDYWAFYTTKGTYLGWTGSNKLYELEELSSNSSWTITFDETTHAVKIANVADPKRLLQFNTNQNTQRFCCYTGTQENPYLFKQGKVTTKPEPFVTPEFTTIADLKAYTAQTAVKVTMDAWKITSLNGNNLYLTDGVDTVLVYDYNIPAEYEEGGKLTGTIEASWKYYETGDVWEIVTVKDWTVITYEAGIPTGVVEVEKANSAVNNGNIFNLTGQKIAAPTKGQLYIVNGKKKLF